MNHVPLYLHNRGWQHAATKHTAGKVVHWGDAAIRWSVDGTNASLIKGVTSLSKNNSEYKIQGSADGLPIQIWTVGCFRKTLPFFQFIRLCSFCFMALFKQENHLKSLLVALPTQSQLFVAAFPESRPGAELAPLAAGMRGDTSSCSARCPHQSPQCSPRSTTYSKKRHNSSLWWKIEGTGIV